MYKVLNQSGIELCVCPNLDLALTTAKQLGFFVTIQGPGFEVCGCFGVDSVRDGVCPDGVAYDWNKSSRIGRVKKERISR